MTRHDTENQDHRLSTGGLCLLTRPRARGSALRSDAQFRGVGATERHQRRRAGGSSASSRTWNCSIPTARAWGIWDEIHGFIVDRNEQHVPSKLNPQAIKSLGVNVLAFYTPDGKRTWGLTYDHETGEEIAASASSRPTPSGLSHPLLGEPANEGPYCRPVAGGRAPARDGNAPLLTSESRGPSRGRVVVGRLLMTATHRAAGGVGRGATQHSGHRLGRGGRAG